MSADQKFEKEDLPKILIALHKAKESGQSSRVIVDFASDGGVIAIQLESKMKLK